MPYKRIDVAIDKDGTVHVDTSGFTGTTCLKEAEALIALLQEAGLDVKTLNVEKKEEYHHVEERSGVTATR